MPVVDSYLSPRPTQRGAAMPKPSMNYSVRKQEAFRIAQENLRLLDRIVHTRSVMSHDVLDRGARDQRKFLRQLGTRPIGEPGSGVGAAGRQKLTMQRRLRSRSPRARGAGGGRSPRAGGSL